MNSRGHRSSLYVSHTLWRLRNAIGEQEMSSMIKPFIDNVVSFETSFRKWQKQNPFRKGPPFQVELHYIYATLLRTGNNATSHTLETLAQEFHLDFQRIKSISEQLSSDSSRLVISDADRQANRQAARFRVGLGVAMAAADATILTLQLNHFLSSGDDDDSDVAEGSPPFTK
jgi:hypothetical protein